MCIAIAKQAGLAITKEILKTCFENNPDGAGFCIEENNSLSIHKGFFTFEEFYAAFEPHGYKKALIHFRIRTHGNIDTDNCHPLEVTENIAFIHNGMIKGMEDSKTQSDTVLFNNHILKPLIQSYGKQVLLSSQIKQLIESFIGFSKLAFLVKGQDDFLIFNEHLGNKSKEGIWFSNHSWDTPKYIPKSPITQSVLPLPYHTKQKDEVWKIDIENKCFTFGVEVETTCDIHTEKGTIYKGATGIVDRVYSNKTVDIDFYPEGKIHNLYPYTLKIIDAYPSLL